MATITIMDPVTRIEGHLRVEVTIGGGLVTDARCAGTLFRGFEAILAGRDPLDATVITQRICGVCPISHGMASVKALDAAGGRAIPANARILRNLTLGANYLQSHILHFYLLAALDFVRGPAAAPWAPGWDVDLRPGLDAVAGHLPTALEARRRAHEMGAIFGGRMPTSHCFVPGGFTAVPSAALIAAFRAQLAWLSDFIRTVYLPDVEAVGGVYGDYLAIGAGHRNLIAYGVFDLDASGGSKLLRDGFVDAAHPGSPSTVNTASITEAVTHSWYRDSTGTLNPSVGRTEPQYPKPSGYSWLKAPRYAGKACEAGPLARMWANGDYRRGVSVIDRHLARAHEALKIAGAMDGWLDQLVPGQPVYDGGSMPASGAGVGLTEAPRGALGHWVEISGGRVARYQVVTPTCWNASPRDGAGVPGPMEQALIGTPVQDPERPVEALRVIHSFDPCLSCAVHVMTPRGEPRVIRTGGAC